MTTVQNTATGSTQVLRLSAMKIRYKGIKSDPTIYNHRDSCSPARAAVWVEHMYTPGEWVEEFSGILRSWEFEADDKEFLNGIKMERPAAPSEEQMEACILQYVLFTCEVCGAMPMFDGIELPIPEGCGMYMLGPACFRGCEMHPMDSPEQLKQLAALEAGGMISRDMAPADVPDLQHLIDTGMICLIDTPAGEEQRYGMTPAGVAAGGAAVAAGRRQRAPKPLTGKQKRAAKRARGM